jgi:hypothetical protein
MKKFVVLSLISFLVLAFGATVYSQEKAPALEFKASGWIDMSAQWKLNVPEAGSGDTANDTLYGPVGAAAFRPGGAAFDTHEAWARSRGRLKFDAIMGKEMTGTFQFEFDADKWGGSAGAGAQRNQLGHWQADRAGLEVKHMFITFGMPWIPIPITIQAGIQPISVRGRVNLYNDGAGVTVAAKIDPALIKLMWFKPTENKNTASDDADIYGLEANAKIQTLTVGGYGLYYNMNSYQLYPGALGISATTGVTTAAVEPGYSADMWWIGAYLDGKLGPINLTFDFGLDTGTVKDRRDLAVKAGDVDYTGWMARAEVSYPWEKLTFGGVFSYGTGSDANKTSVSGLPGTNAANGTVTKTVGGYVFAPGSEGGPGDLMIINAHPDFDRGTTGYFGGPASQMARNLYGGLWYGKVFAAMKVTDMYKVTLAGAYIGDTTKHGNTLGNAVTSTGALRDDSSIGWEFDLLNQIMLYKNLTWDIGFGYLVANKGLDYALTATTNKSPKDPYALVSRLTYSF